MNGYHRNSATTHTTEMLSLNLDDLNVEELERRVEMAAAFSAGELTRCGTNDCGALRYCGTNG